MSLNEYHLQFLEHLVRHNVKFIVVGGQAQHFRCPNYETADLDIWARLAPDNRKRLEQALVSWSRQHPQHTNRPLTPPLNLRPNIQVHFPESDGVRYIDRAKKMAQVDANQGIDVLTSLGDLDFADAMSRAGTISIESLTLNYLGQDDLKRTRKEGK
jgi:hypothetical protein